MNKISNILVVVFIFLVVLLSFISVNFYNQNKDQSKMINSLKKENENLKNEAINQNTQETSNSTEYNNIIVITSDDFDEKIANKETFAILMTQTSCGHCKEFKPILNSVLEENNLFFYELDLQQTSSTARIKIINNLNLTSTPTLIFYEKGVELTKDTRLIGNKSKEKLESHLKEIGYLQ